MKKHKANSEKIINWVKTVIAALLSAAIGLALGWLFSENYKWGIILIVVISAASIICWIIIACIERKFNILRMVRNDKKCNRNYEVIRFGLGMSRPLYLSGRDFERVQIGSEVLKAIDDYDKENILCGAATKSKKLLRAQFLIEDCGWSLYMSGVKDNVKHAKFNIEQGLLECAMLTITEENQDEIFTLIFRGIRHLLGIFLYSFSESKLADLLQNDRLEYYKKPISFYGELLGFLLSDSTMYGSETSLEFFQGAFRQIVADEQHIDKLFERFYSWMQEKLKKQSFEEEILIQSHEFKAQYFLEEFRFEYCNDIKNRQTTEYLSEQESEYLKHAQDNAIKLILISSESDSDISILKNLPTVYDCLSNHMAFFQQSPNEERLAKGYILLGTSLMEQNTAISLKYAHELFKKGMEVSDKIDCISTYIQAQRKRITILHRIYKFESETLANEIKKDRINDILLLMKKIETDTIRRIGGKDSGMDFSLKEKRKFYHKELQSCK